MAKTDLALEDRVLELEALLEDVAEAKVTAAHVRDADQFYEDPDAFLRLVPLLVGFDPSLRMSAFAAVTLDGQPRPVIAGTCPTSASVKRGDYFLFRMLDDAKRARKVYLWASSLLEALPPGYCLGAIAIESPSGIPTSFARPKPGDPPRPKGWRPPQDAAAFGKMIRAGQAVYDAAALAFDGSPILVSTYAAKEAATGAKRPKDGKDEVERCVRRLFGAAAVDEVLRGVAGGKDGRQGVCDALAVCLAALGDVPVLAAVEEYRRALEAS